MEFRVGVGEWSQGSGVRGQESGVRSWSSELELESGIKGQGSGVRGQYAGVRSWSSELELESGIRGQGLGVSERCSKGAPALALLSTQGSGVSTQGSGVGGGAKVRARGFGVFAEGSPRRSLRPPPTTTKIYGWRWSEGPSEGIRRIRRGLPEEEPSDTAAYSGSAILTVVPSPILLEIVIFPPSSAVRRSMPESP